MNFIDELNGGSIYKYVPKASFLRVLRGRADYFAAGQTFVLRVGDGATPRYQALAAGATPAAGFLEIDVKGLGGPPGRRAFAWKSGVYLGGQQVGFHGGCSLEEMVVPMAWLAARGLQADEPAWWYGAGALPVMEPVRRTPDPTPTPPPPVAAPQLQLFDPSGRPISPEACASHRP